ncbi:acyltransferase family protein [Natrinema salinisoli]|uniref:acyltransferase family protein n=1 Tax=Natrinema salinisoli TaxID=2878535 RepID=UPI001CEFBBE3|nr:acyltransferase [Natrinema salinisoli]
MSGRIHSLDAMRIVAIVFVVLIHTDPFQGINTYGNAINFGTKTISRFAVPFFFITSGYFFALKTSHRGSATYLTKRAIKLISLYLFGLVLAVPTFFGGQLARAELSGRSLQATAVSSVIEYLDPVELVYYGTSVSEILWFLPALLFSLLFVYLVVVIGNPSYVLPIAVCFHLVGLLGSTYTMFVDVPFETRDALFFGFLYTGLGYTICTRGWEPSKEKSRLLFGTVVMFVVSQFIEFYLLGYLLRGEPFGSYVYAPSYGISTALLSISLFLFLLSRPTLFADTPLPEWGTYAVGIYVTHPTVFAILRAFRDTLESMGYTIDSMIVWHLMSTPATIVGALVLYVFAHKLRLIEIGGSHLPGEPWLRTRRSN